MADPAKEESPASPKEEQAAEKKEAESKQVKYSIDLSVPSIIAALHQKAIGSAEKKAKDIRIANSAIESDGKTAKLNSAGQHIISVLSTNEKDGVVKKQDALVALQEYVTWFVGPDLGKKVTDKVILPLGNGEEGEQQSSDEDNEGETEEEKNADEAASVDNDSPDNEETKDNEEAETISDSIHVKSFGEFLVENCGLKFLLEDGPDDDDAPSEDDEEGEEAEKKSAEEKERAESSGQSSDEKEDPKNPSAKGWYIAYNLKVQGLKETALKDAMKQFATSFFDNLTITSSGLFGSGKQFTGKDIRKGIHKLMHVDHKELATKVGDYIAKKFPNLTSSKVEARDKNTLLKEISGKGSLTPDQKEAISSAQYSLAIKIEEKDPKKPFLNTSKIADVIRKCLGFFRIGKKAQVTKDSIIHIENYTEDASKTNKEAEQRLKDEKAVPGLDELKGKLSKKKTNLEAYDYLLGVFRGSTNGLDKKGSFDKSTKLKAAVETWDKFAKAHPREKFPSGDKAYDEKLFKDFLAAYEKFCKDNEVNNESMPSVHLYSKHDVASMLLEMLFEETDIEPNVLFEDDDADAEEDDSESGSSESGEGEEGSDEDVKADKCEKEIDDLKSEWKNIAKKYVEDANAKIVLLEKDEVLKNLQYDDKSKLEAEFSKNEELNYCLAIDFDSSSKLAESKTSAKIFSLLFEQDLSNDEWKEIIKKHKDGELQFPETTDPDSGSKREMSLEELRGALHSDIINYKNGEFIQKTEEEVAKDVDVKQLEVSAKDVETQVIAIEDKTEKDLTQAFEEFKKYAGVDAAKNFGELVILEKTVKESISSEDGNMLNESLILEGHSEEQLNVEKEIDRIGVENLTKNVDELRKNYLEFLGKVKKDNPKNEYVQKILVNSKNWISKEFIGKLRDQEEADVGTIKKMLKDCVSRVGKTNDVKFELQALVDALKKLPDGPKKDDEQTDEDEKITITFKDIEDPSQLSDPEAPSDDDKKKYEQLGDPLKLVPGEDVKIPEVEDKGEKKEWKFIGFEPDPENMDETGDTYAIYSKEDIKTVKITFYDADPESGEKLDKPLHDSIEIPEGESINSSEEVSELIEELNKQLLDNQKEGFTFDGWNPDVKEKASEDVDVVAKYKTDDSEPPAVMHSVTFIALSNPADPNSEKKIIEVNGMPMQAIQDGEKAARPAEEDIPEIEGYKFKGWGDAESKLDSVKEDVDAIARYEPVGGIIPVDNGKKYKAYLMPFAYYKKKDDGETPPTPPNGEDGGDDGGNDEELEKHGADLYIYPIASSKDFESDGKIENDD